MGGNVGVRWKLFAAVAAGALVTACGTTTTDGQSTEGGNVRPQVLSAADVEREAPRADAAIAPTVAGMSAFGYDLVRGLDEPEQNAVVSPASIAYAFGMVRAGAAGRTATQLDQALGFPEDGLHPALNAITQRAGTTGKAPPPAGDTKKRKPDESPEPPVVAIANGLFAKAGLEARQEFLRTLAAQYGANVQTLDFRNDPQGAVRAINEWAAEQTADRIRKVFEELPEDTALVLANAVYLKAEWQSQFSENDTVDEDFTKLDGSTTTAKMMHQQANLGYALGDGWQAVELPYAGDELVMRVIVPTGDVRPVELLKPATLAAVDDGMRSDYIDFAMPRFDFATNVELGKQLRALGMTDAFDPGAADFSGMAAEDLYIGQAVHRANITVDERGTEAAAVTAVGMRTTALPPEPKVKISADRAFAFTITHKATGTPLFTGQVTDPAEQ